MTSKAVLIRNIAGGLAIAVIAGVLISQYLTTSQFTRLADEIDRTPIRVDQSVLESYTGTYELRPGFRVNVTATETGLLAQATNQTQVAFHPATQTVFFNDITPLLMKFEQDEQGNVTGFQALEPGRNRLAVRVE